MGWFSRKSDTRAQAERYIREQTALYRHYCISEVVACVWRSLSVAITESEAVEIVQKIRDEKELGPISSYNMPGYIEEE